MNLVNLFPIIELLSGIIKKEQYHPVHVAVNILNSDSLGVFTFYGGLSRNQYWFKPLAVCVEVIIGLDLSVCEVSNHHFNPHQYVLK